MRILIIDDDPDLRSLLGHYIKQRWADWTVDEYDPLERNFPAEDFPLGDYQALILDYMAAAPEEAARLPEDSFSDGGRQRDHRRTRDESRCR